MHREVVYHVQFLMTMMTFDVDASFLCVCVTSVFYFTYSYGEKNPSIYETTSLWPKYSYSIIFLLTSLSNIYFFKKIFLLNIHVAIALISFYGKVHKGRT